MNIKYKTSLIRDLLYMLATIRNGKISLTAEQNGIKPSNLSKLLKQLEEDIGCRLLNRTNKGIQPTNEGKEIYKLISEIEENLAQLEDICKPRVRDNILNLYMAKSLCISNLEDFKTDNPQLKIINVETEEVSDIAVLNCEPLMQGRSIAKFTIGQDISQNLWISCNENNKNALKLFDFIVSQLHF